MTKHSQFLTPPPPPPPHTHTPFSPVVDGKRYQSVKKLSQFSGTIWPRGYKTLFLFNRQLSTKFILLIIVEMPTSERLKARNCFTCRYFSVYVQLKFHARLSFARKIFCNLGPGLKLYIQTDPHLYQLL